MAVDPDEPDIKAPYEPLTLDLFPASTRRLINESVLYHLIIPTEKMQRTARSEFLHPSGPVLLSYLHAHQSSVVMFPQLPHNGLDCGCVVQGGNA